MNFENSAHFDFEDFEESFLNFLSAFNNINTDIKLHYYYDNEKATLNVLVTEKNAVLDEIIINRDSIFEDDDFMKTIRSLLEKVNKACKDDVFDICDDDGYDSTDTKQYQMFGCTPADMYEEVYEFPKDMVSTVFPRNDHDIEKTLDYFDGRLYEVNWTSEAIEMVNYFWDTFSDELKGFIDELDNGKYVLVVQRAGKHFYTLPCFDKSIDFYCYDRGNSAIYVLHSKGIETLKEVSNKIMGYLEGLRTELVDNIATANGDEESEE